jgi:hemerythrin-like metal-binding protein
LLEAMKQGQASDVIAQIVLDLETYAFLHFQKEEFFFQRFNFQGSDEHIKEHQDFKKTVATLKSDLKSGKITLTFELLKFLKDWIEHHVLIIDKQYTECFRQNGLK